MRLFTPALLTVALCTSAFAEDTPRFQADAQVGAILTSGNTDSTALKGKLEIRQNLASWRNNYVLEALFKEDEVEYVVGGATVTEEQVTAEKYFASAQADYKLNEQYRGLFLFGSYEDDRFSGYAYQATVAAGYSDALILTDRNRLLYSIGPGYSFYETDDTLNDQGDLTEGESDDSVIIRFSADYTHTFSESAKFTQLVSVDYAPDSDKNTKTRSETALTTKINDAFALKASFTVTQNSEVPEDIEKTDTQTALTLVYSF